MTHTAAEIRVVVGILAERRAHDTRGYTLLEAVQDNAQGWTYLDPTSNTGTHVVAPLSLEDLRAAYRRAGLPPERRGRPALSAAERRQQCQVFLHPKTVAALKAQQKSGEGLGPVIDRLVGAAGASTPSVKE